MTVTILLADDHPIVRQGLRNLLENETDFHVLGEAGDGIEAIEMVDRIKPDVLIVDMMMPGLNGLEVLRQALKRHSRMRVIVLSMQGTDTYVVEAMNNGASGYVLKDTGPGEIVNAVREVVHGGRYLSPRLSERLQDASADTSAGALTEPYESLTNREREILQMTVEGLTSSQIAGRLFISPRTVELHRSRVMKKLGLRSQAELVRYAVKRGILPLDT